MAENYLLTAEERIRAKLIAGKFQKDLDLNTLSIMHPTPWVSEGNNTRVQILVYDIYGIRNNLVMEYTRDALSDLIAQDTVVTVEGATRSHELLPAILTDYGINLTPSDIVDEDLTDTAYVLKATPDSLGFIGDVQIQLGGTGDLGFTLIRTVDERLIKVGNLYLRRS